MPSSERLPSSQRLPWLPLALMIAALLLRVAQQHHVLMGWPNVSPMMALAFAGAVVFPEVPCRGGAWAVILLGGGLDQRRLGLVGPQANGHLEVLLAYGCYALAAYYGARSSGAGRECWTPSSGTLACSILFYLVTNTLSWWINPLYAKRTARAGCRR